MSIRIPTPEESERLAKHEGTCVAYSSVPGANQFCTCGADERERAGANAALETSRGFARVDKTPPVLEYRQVEAHEIRRLEAKADWARRAAVWLRQLEKEQPQFLNRGTWLEFRALLSELDDE